jgi:hypothetical protein
MERLSGAPGGPTMRKMSRHVVMAIALLAPCGLTAQGMMGNGGGMPNGTGMVTVASDGSLLATQMGMSMMGGPTGGGQSLQRAIVSIGTNGAERWRATFTDGWPMMAANNGDLVVVVVMNNAWMWRSMSAMGWFPWGTPPQGGTGSEAAILVGLSLSSGVERWRTTLPGDMGSFPQFAPDGSRIYVSVTDVGQGSMMGGGSMRQGDTGGWGTQMTNKIVALDRNGAIQWTRDLSVAGGMM